MSCDAGEGISGYRPMKRYGVMTEEKRSEQSLVMLKPEGTTKYGNHPELALSEDKIKGRE